MHNQSVPRWHSQVEVKCPMVLRWHPETAMKLSQWITTEGQTGAPFELGL
jgi:hypothetical protein